MTRSHDTQTAEQVLLSLGITSTPAVETGHVVDETTRYAQILIDLDTQALDRRTFTYSIPPEFNDLIDIGIPVQVPFGHMKELTGYVVGFTQYIDKGIRVRAILDVLDDAPLFDLAYLQFLDWIAQYYACPLMTVLATALPPAILQKSQRRVRLAEALIHPSMIPTRIAADEKAILMLLFQKPEEALSVHTLQRRSKLSRKKINKVLAALRQKQLILNERHLRHKIGEKTQTIVTLGNGTSDKAPTPVKLTGRQKALYDVLAQYLATGPKPLRDVIIACKTTRPTLNKLAEKNYLSFRDDVIHRDRSWVAGHENTGVLNRLTPEQREATEAIQNAKPQSEWLLYGVTGSGKTEVYLALTEEALQHGKSVLILLPEITLTSHIARRFIDAFGPEQVVLWHSQLTAAEKVDAWKRIQTGDLKIIIGARSAIFTPIENLGYIIIDEEHESSFKQESPNPRYNAKTLAQKLIKLRDAKLVFGSATPEVSSYYHAEQAGHILRLPGRFAGRAMADVSIINLSKEAEFGPKQSLSPKLIAKLQEALDNKQQAMLLLNRRGFHTYIQCDSCKCVHECPSCSVSLTWHSNRGVVRCHHCGYEAEKPRYCPQCASYHLSFTGMGTQRLEAELEKFFPDARILRLDGDVMQSKMKYREILDAFRKHEADILVGTQMIAKGIDIANVTLVGVIGADSILNMPDYRSNERAFQMLTQVAGRAGRGELPGEVYIQAWKADSPIFEHILNQDYQGFYRDEIVQRQEWLFPPYSQLFRIIVSSEDDDQARYFIEALALNWKATLAQHPYHEKILTLGPAPCLITRVQNRWRYHLLIQNTIESRAEKKAAHKLITDFYKAIKAPSDLTCILDVDALSLF